MAYFEVEKYQVFKYASAGVENASASIQAWGGGHHATLIFLKPNAKMIDSTAQVLYYKDTDFAVMVDIFRNERPVNVNTNHPFFVMTEQETVGEFDVAKIDEPGTK